MEDISSGCGACFKAIFRNHGDTEGCSNTIFKLCLRGFQDEGKNFIMCCKQQLEAWSLAMGQAVLEFSKSLILGSGLRTFTNMSPGNSQSLGCFLSYHCGFLCHDWLFPI